MPRVTFHMPYGKARVCEAEAGSTLLEIAWKNRIGIEGACEGMMACSTCHVIVDPAWAGKLRPASDEELEMLDLAWGLTATSRLGCQLVLTDALDGLEVALPAQTNNMMDF
jgi:ferredoxin